MEVFVNQKRVNLCEHVVKMLHETVLGKSHQGKEKVNVNGGEKRVKRKELSQTPFLTISATYFEQNTFPSIQAVSWHKYPLKHSPLMASTSITSVSTYR